MKDKTIIRFMEDKEWSPWYTFTSLKNLPLKNLLAKKVEIRETMTLSEFRKLINPK